MMIDCDEGMIVALLRNWRPNRLRPQGVRLASLRPMLIKRQDRVCARPDCPHKDLLLTDDGSATHVDHIVTVQDFAGRILQGEAFDEAYCRLWDESNLRVLHRTCNYELAREQKDSD